MLENENSPADFSLDVIDVASPCRANWADMEGDDTARHCGQCDMMVYNLSNMTRQEAEDFTRSREGRTCVRFYRRYDGTVLTSDCPIGAKALKYRLLRTALAVCAVVGLLLVTPLYAMSMPFRALGAADPLKSVRGWMQPDQLIQLMVTTPPPEPAIMGDVAMPMAAIPPNNGPTNNAKPIVLPKVPGH